MDFSFGEPKCLRERDFFGICISLKCFLHSQKKKEMKESKVKKLFRLVKREKFWVFVVVFVFGIELRF